MVSNRLTKNGNEMHKKKYTGVLDEIAIRNLTIDQLVTKNTRRFFQRLRIDDSFLNINPSTLPNLNIYKNASDNVSWLNVVNDPAERAVSLMKEVNLKVKSEDQIQAILQTVSEYRKFSPTCTKESLSRDFLQHLYND